MPARSRKDARRIARATPGAVRRAGLAAAWDGRLPYPLAVTVAHGDMPSPGNACSSRSCSWPPTASVQPLATALTAPGSRRDRRHAPRRGRRGGRGLQPRHHRLGDRAGHRRRRRHDAPCRRPDRAAPGPRGRPERPTSTSASPSSRPARTTSSPSRSTSRSSIARVEALSLRSQSTGSGPGTGGAIGDDGRHRLVAVFSPKGGVGTTTIATNLALIAAERAPQQGAAHRPRPLVRSGGVAPQPAAQADAARARPRRRGAPRARAVPDLRDPPPERAPRPRGAADAGPRGARSPRSTSSSCWRGRSRPTTSSSSTPAPPSTTGCSRSSAAGRHRRRPGAAGDPGAQRRPPAARPADRDGSPRRPDRVRAQQRLRPRAAQARDIETALGSKIAADLPYDPIVYLKAVNEGNPVVRSAPKSPAADKLRALATIVFGAVLVPAARQAAKSDKRGRFGRR